MDITGLYHRISPQLHRFLHRRTGSAETAEDLVQESFLRLLTVSLPEEEARRWLFVVAGNLARDHVRTHRRRDRLIRPERLVPDGEAPPDEALERKEAVVAVRTALESLSPRARAVLLLREEGYSYEEIARKVGVSPASVGKLAVRAARAFVAAYPWKEEGDGAR